ncbi:50S ribosomal protein L25 [soil metagenome]
MPEINIQAEKRTDHKGSTNTNLRRSGMVPGILYGLKGENVPIAVKENALRPLIYTKDANTFNVSVEGGVSSLKCIMKDVQFHPLTEKPIHFDFFGLEDATREIHLEVSIHLIGNAIGVMRDHGVLQHIIHKLDIACLPKDIPGHIEINIEGLEIGHSIKVSDLKYDGLRILNDPQAAVVAVIPPVQETVAAPVADAVKEPEVVTKGKKEEK